MKVCIVFNPTARGDKAVRFRRELQSLPSEWSLIPTDAPGAGRRLATQAVREGFQTIVAAGGDGTVNEVLNGWLDACGSGPTPKLGVLPLGTVNVFAKELGLPTSLDMALSVIRQGITRWVDVPTAVLQTETGSRESRAFAQLGGAGLDSRAIARVRYPWKRKIGPLAYVVAGLEALRESAPIIEVTSEERSAAGDLVLIGNGRYYGGKITLFPKADLSDGLLDVAVFPKAHLGALLRFGAGLLTGNPHRFGGAVRWQSRRLELRCAGRMPFELDGDNVGLLPASVSMSTRRVAVIVPG